MNKQEPFKSGDIYVEAAFLTNGLLRLIDDFPLSVLFYLPNNLFRDNNILFRLGDLAHLVELIVLHESLVSEFSLPATEFEYPIGLEQIIRVDRLQDLDTDVYEELAKLMKNSTSKWKLDQAVHALTLGLPIVGRSNDEIIRVVTNLSRNRDRSIYLSVKNNIINQITRMSKKKIDEMNLLLSRDRYKLDVPIIFNYVLEHVNRKKDIIPAALEVRQSKEATALRKQLSLLDEFTRLGEDELLVPLLIELEDKLKTLGKKLDQNSIGIQIGFPWSIAFNPIGVFKHFQYKRKRHLFFIDKIYNTAIRTQTVYTKLSRLQ